MNDTTITLIGNAVEDVDLRFTPSGAAVAKFRLASTPRYLDKASNTWKDGEGLFLTVNAWRDMAEHVANSVTKGARLVVVGKLRQRSYDTREGEKRTVYEVEADEVAVSLKFAEATIKKMARGSQGDAPRGGSDQDPWATATPANAGSGRQSGFADDAPPF